MGCGFWHWARWPLMTFHLLDLLVIIHKVLQKIEFEFVKYKFTAQGQGWGLVTWQWKYWMGSEPPLQQQAGSNMWQKNSLREMEYRPLCKACRNLFVKCSSPHHHHFEIEDWNRTAGWWGGGQELEEGVWRGEGGDRLWVEWNAMVTVLSGNTGSPNTANPGQWPFLLIGKAQVLLFAFIPGHLLPSPGFSDSCKVYCWSI